jgi:glycerate 2-kinase
MRVVIAPGSFGAALSAVEAAAAIAEGWARRAPHDDLILAPVSDGGAGYVDVLHASLGGELLGVSVPDAFGVPRPGAVLIVGDTAYVESAQAVGVRPGTTADPERGSSFGVGRLVADAIGAGAERVVVGVGATGVASNDGGAGLLAGLGATSHPVEALRRGSAELGTLVEVDVAPVLDLVGATRLVLATDDDGPLLGLLGTTSTAGRRRGLAADRIPLVDDRLEHLAEVIGRRHALTKGAGAGGGIGFALLVAGATKAPGLGTVTDEIALAESAAHADLVVTGEEAFDLSAGSGRVATGVADVAGSVVRPCIALANRVAVGARETRALGIESAYAVEDLVGADATGEPAEKLAALAERVARTWSWSR